MNYRDLFLRAIVMLGVAVFAITELLSAFGAIHRVPLLVCWILVAIAGGVFFARSNLRSPKTAFDPVVILSTLLPRSRPRSPPQKLLIPASRLLDFHSCLIVRQRAKASAKSQPSPDVHRLMILSARSKPPMQPMVVILVVFGYVLY